MKRDKQVIAKDAMGTVTQETWTPETPQEQGKAFKQAFRCKPSGWNINHEIAEIRELIDTALDGMGWPRSGDQLAISPNGNWRKIASPDELKDREQQRWAFLWISKAAEPLSETYFLGKMAFEVECIEQAIKSGDLLSMHQHSAKLGAHQTKIDLRKIALRYAEIGHKYSVKSQEGADKRRGDFAPHTDAVLSEMERLIENGLSISNAAGITAQKGIGKSKVANRALWHRHCGKLRHTPEP